MKRDEKYGSSPITPQELEEVFGWCLAHDEAVLIERVAPKASVGTSGLILPEGSRRDRQTGSTAGVVIQIGQTAETELNEKLGRFGKQIEIGGIVSFSYAAPVDLGLLDDYGLPMLSGVSESPYAGLSLINYRDVLGYYSKKKPK